MKEKYMKNRRPTFWSNLRTSTTGKGRIKRLEATNRWIEYPSDRPRVIRPRVKSSFVMEAIDYPMVWKM
jgi:hypothetical protein